ncbi:MAG: SUMF1/EgtB/PvdO family nonheme iron enzyme [Nitrosomonadales bacterium]|nr:SUMF1/EgtB/PvdO family nonheme iron enzyme [Nitrosomonadales bacterium]
MKNYDNEHDWRVLRGGSWVHDPQSARTAARNRIGPAFRGLDLGFRLASI